MQSMVIRTRSVEFMPFLLSLFNFINGAVWFGYAFVGQLDIFIAVSEL
jgi:solute carrier family 50 protein (sugar transporter)